jgi:uncharacterized membrane protein
MKNLPDIGRIFFAVAIIVIGILTAYDHQFPYFLIPPKLSWRPDSVILHYFFGLLIVLAGALILLKKQTRLASLALGVTLVLVYIFYYIPFQFIVTDFTQLGQWENGEKELDLACGALIVASFFIGSDDTSTPVFLKKLVSLAPILFAITIITYGILHFMIANSVAEYVPEWIPARLFWAYFAGAALIASGIAIILKIKVELASFLLGVMIFIWFAVLHVPRIVVSPAAYMSSEISSACLALAYSGTAFMIGSFQKSS